VSVFPFLDYERISMMRHALLHYAWLWCTGRILVHRDPAFCTAIRMMSSAERNTALIFQSEKDMTIPFATKLSPKSHHQLSQP